MAGKVVLVGRVPFGALVVGAEVVVDRREIAPALEEAAGVEVALMVEVGILFLLGVGIAIESDVADLVAGLSLVGRDVGSDVLAAQTIGIVAEIFVVIDAVEAYAGTGEQHDEDGELCIHGDPPGDICIGRATDMRGLVCHRLLRETRFCALLSF